VPELAAKAALPGLLIHDAAEVATLAGGLRRGSAQSDVAEIRSDGPGSSGSGFAPALAAYEGRIVAVGRLVEVEAQLSEMGIDVASLVRVDARGGTVTPGLIDPHTHLLFGGTRHAEVEMRHRGHSYLEILAAGGGILQTVRATRAASDEQLLGHGRRWLREMLGHGVTTVEAKSGYGLDVDTELRLLRVAAARGGEGPGDGVPTFLGAHAVAPEFRELRDPAGEYVEHIVEQMLPDVARQGLARSVDVFSERGVFDVPHARRVLETAGEYGLAPRLHADQLADSGAAQLAAEMGALSADHLGAVSDAGIDALATAADGSQPTVATLLPIADFYLGHDMGEGPTHARRLVDAGVPVAIGTDFNPGTAPAPNAQLALSFAVHRLTLTAPEALSAMTINAAAALGMAESHGSLEVGKHADIAIWSVDSHDLLPYWVGANLAQAVIKSGRVVYEAPRG
jgi:imidazolonepropionase